MVQDKLLSISKDEHLLLKGLIPVIIKSGEDNLSIEKNSIKRKGLKVSNNILVGFNNKLNKIKF